MTSTVDGALEALGTGLDDQQREAVFAPSSALCVLAGAGSGKTTVLTRRVARRIADGSADGDHVLVLTFTRKAAEELRQRLRDLNVEGQVTAGTFHSVAYAQLRRRWLDSGRSVPAIASQPYRLVDRVLEALRLERSINARQVVTEISWSKSKRMTPDNYGDRIVNEDHRPSISVTQFTKIYRAYEMEKRKRHVVDYDDLLLLLTEALETDRSFAAAQQWMFRHFFVDEFQDVNRAQFDLLQAWMGEQADHFVVGDPNQAIYGWNGSDASYINDVARFLPGTELLRIDRNYRSTTQVLQAAASVLSNTTVGNNPEGAPLRVRMYVDERAEAVGIARAARRMHGNGYRWSDIAVLVRTNAQRSHIEQALSDYGVPYRSGSGTSWMQDPEVQNVLEVLREEPARDLSQRLDDVLSAREDIPESKRASLHELERAMRSCLSGEPTMSCAAFVTWMEVASKYDGPSTAAEARAVTVSTFHRAKGLEWPVVFLAGIEDGLVPFGGMKGSTVEEERRLFYVALTRSKEHVFCSWAQERSGPQGVSERSPSPWLENVGIAGAQTTDLPDADTVHHNIDLSREELGAGTEEPVSQSECNLRNWRNARARLSGVDPALIMTDRVIDQICRLNPQKPEDLRAIEGFGPVRIAAEGGQILAVMRDRD